jgi:integrase
MYAGSNPCERVELPKVNNAVVRSLTSQQMKSLLGALCEIEENDSVIDANFIRFLLFTGCRAGEAMKLQWKDIDFVSKQLHLRDPKGGIDQWIPLNDTAIGMLTKHRQEIPRENPLVFPSKVTGKQRNEFRWPWKKAKNIAELPEEFRLHDLRHTFASWLASSGKVDIYTLQTLLTHKNVSTTQRYAHLFPGVVHRGSEVFSDMVSDLEDDNVVRVDFG